jgi:hypothetical protein
MPRPLPLPLLLAASLPALACGAPRGTARERTPVAACATQDSAATLRVVNYSGRAVELLVQRPPNPAQPLGIASPGSRSFEIRGTSDLDVRYVVRDQATGELLSVVSWMRPTSRNTRGGVTLELLCGVGAGDA